MPPHATIDFFLMFVYKLSLSNENTVLFSLVKIKGKTCLSWLYFLVEGTLKEP